MFYDNLFINVNFENNLSSKFNHFGLKKITLDSNDLKFS